MFTTNVEFSTWGTVFADDKLAAAIVDRVVHHDRLVESGCPSHRLEEPLMLGKSGIWGRARARSRKSFVAKPERKECSFTKARLD